MPSCEDADYDDDDVAQHCRKKPSARADQRRSRGENGAALISWHQHVTDVALAAGRAHLTGEILMLRIGPDCIK